MLTFCLYPLTCRRDLPAFRSLQGDSSMARRTRRDFLKTIAAGAAVSTFTISGTKSSGMVLGSNERINVAVAGFHGRGQSHIGALAGGKDTRIIYLIDPDTRLWDGAVKTVEKKGGNTPKCVQD